MRVCSRHEWAVVVAVLIAAALGSSCSTEVRHTPAVLVAESPQGHPVTLVAETVLLTETNYPRTLRAGSKWIPIGYLAQGLVLRPAEGVLTVEGSNVHEAYLVVDAGVVVGLYLPVERAFSAIASRTRLLTK